MGAQEVGLTLNHAKCGWYARKGEDEEGEHNDIAPFLPEIREGYKYLGLHQLERDTLENFEAIENKVLEKVDMIAASDLTTSQKVTLLNSTVNPATNYILGNIYPNEKRATTLKRCRDLDKKVRKKLVLHKIKGKTTSNAHVYMQKEKGGLGLRAIELEAELQYVKRGVYVLMHGDMSGALRVSRAKTSGLEESNHGPRTCAGEIRVQCRPRRIQRILQKVLQVHIRFYKR